MKERSDFFIKAARWIKRHALYPNSIILGGDLNCCLNDRDRRPSNSVKNDYSRKSLIKLMNSLGLTDCWTKVNDNKLGFTFFNKSTGGASRLDYIFISDSFPFEIKSMKVSSCVVPDHESVIASFKTHNHKRGPGYWKFNNSHLENSEFKANIKEIICNTRKELKEIKSYRLLWELLKIRIKEFSISFSVKKAHENRNNAVYLEHRLNSVLEKLNSYDVSSNSKYSKDLLNEKISLQNQMNTIHDEKSKGNIIRSRIKWIEEGEKSSSYFLKLEKIRQSGNVIKTTQTEKGVSHSQEDVMNDIKDFYTKLYSSSNITKDKVDEYLNNIQMPKILSETEKLSCEEQISESDLSEAMSKIKIIGPQVVTDLRLNFIKHLCLTSKIFLWE